MRLPHAIPSILLLALAACSDSERGTPRDAGGAEPMGDAGTRPTEAGTRPADAGSRPSDAGTTPTEPVPVDAGEEEPLPSGPPVEQGPPNTSFEPAFPQQTRAPAMRSTTRFDVEEIATVATPWAIAFLPDGRMLVTEKLSGQLFIVSEDGSKSPAVRGVPEVQAGGQGGLLDVELGPDYAQSRLIYLTYYEARPQGGNGLAVARGKLDAGSAPALSDVQVIFRMQPALESDLHAGGRMVFAPDGLLYVTLGERSILDGRVQARELDSHLGKIVRIRPDGTAPQDNPFVGQANARPEIWTLGHRNILAAALDAQNRLWIAEMGPRGGDELNLIQRGKDYGWPEIGYGEEYSGASIHDSPTQQGLEQPVYYWDPVISPSGMTIYSGDLFPEWRNDVFIGALSGTALVRLRIRGDKVVGEERLLTDRGQRIREVVQGPDGALYLLTDASAGKLLKLVPRDP